MLRLRSWASSMMIVSYCVEEPVVLRLGQQDAVGHQLDVRLRPRAVVEADLVADGVAERRVQLLRDARARRDRAAMRRGCVWPIIPSTPRPSSRQILGSCVVLPEPVSPQRMTTWCLAMRSAMSCRRSTTGRSCG